MILLPDCVKHIWHSLIERRILERVVVNPKLLTTISNNLSAQNPSSLGHSTYMCRIEERIILGGGNNASIKRAGSRTVSIDGYIDEVFEVLAMMLRESCKVNNNSVNVDLKHSVGGHGVLSNKKLCTNGSILIR
jgi:hypothetical protein